MTKLDDIDIERRLVGTDVPPIFLEQVPKEFPALEALASPLRLAAIRLEEAQQLWRDKHYGPAVVLAQAVVETHFESAVAALFAVHSSSSLGDAVSHAVRGLSVARKDHRAIYEALSGDILTNGSFWSDYENGRRQRNEWVHGLREIGESSAGAFVLAVVELIAHVESVLRAAGVKDIRARYRITETSGAGWLQLTVTPLEGSDRPVTITIEPKESGADA